MLLQDLKRKLISELFITDVSRFKREAYQIFEILMTNKIIWIVRKMPKNVSYFFFKIRIKLKHIYLQYRKQILTAFLI